MTDKTKLNRRDAIKVLGAAAGASVLANIPAKWSKPELVGSELPAHAQTSCAFGWTATITWSTFGSQDLDIEIDVPGSVTVNRGTPLDPITGTNHSAGDSFQATITVPVGNMINGTWTARVVNTNPSAIPFNLTSSGLGVGCDPSGTNLPVNGNSFVIVEIFDVAGCTVGCA